MNVLLFVTTLLMVMAIATYGQLESFFDLARLRQQHKHYMEKTELKKYNDKQIAVFESLSDESDEDEDEDDTVDADSQSAPETKEAKPVVATTTPKSPKVKADRKLNIYNLLKPKPASSPNTSGTPSTPPEDVNATTNPPATTAAANFKPVATNAILKRLLQELYGHSQFYKRALEKDPEILDKLLAKLPESAELYEGEIDPLTTANQLSEFQLGNDELWDLFYHMLKGTKEYNLEIEPKEGYPPLVKYVKVNPKIQKVRTYLASEEVLRSIYGDPELVKKIVDERRRLYLLVKNETMEAGEASKVFQEQFGSHKFVEDDGLDFTVNKTNPN